MGNLVTQRNIGSYYVGAASIFPQSSAAATVNGSSIDRGARNGALSGSILTSVGAATGAPTTISVVASLQHSPDNSTWTAYQPDGANNAAAAPLTAINTAGELDVDLSLAYRFIRVSAVVSFTGGTSPAINLQSTFVIGGEAFQPAV